MQSASGRGLRRAMVAVGVVAALLIVGAVGTYLLIRANEPPWSKMDAALRTFPVPPGYRVTAQGREGTDCSYNPTCQGAPQVFEHVEADAGTRPTDCNQLTTMARNWQAQGYTDDRPVVGGICDRQGRIDGHAAYLSLVLGAGPGGPHTRAWVKVSITP